MGMLKCEQNFRDVWSRNESVRAEMCQILHTHAAKLVVEIILDAPDVFFWNNHIHQAPPGYLSRSSIVGFFQILKIPFLHPPQYKHGSVVDFPGLNRHWLLAIISVMYTVLLKSIPLLVTRRDSLI